MAVLKKFKNKIRPRWVRTFRQLWQSRWRLAAMTRQLGLLNLAGNPLASSKSSETLFILGSGSSINALTENEWAQIAAADSLGFNFWPIHDHVPTAYVAEVCAVPEGEEENYRRYCELMQIRQHDYAATPIFIKDGERVRADWLREYLGNFPAGIRKNMALTWDWEIPDDTPEAFAATLRRWERWGLLSAEWAPLLRKRASVFYLVLLGLRAGYRQIVLCGVDLDNNAYFYRQREAEYTAKGRPVPQPAVAHAAPVHKTDNLGLGGMPISEALRILDQEILQPRGVRLSVGLQSSKLFPVLPAYFGR